MRPHLNKTSFTNSFIKENKLEADAFKEWVLYPGMLFKASDKWWGDRGRRKTLHEGLDLCFYRDEKDSVLQVSEGMKIPALYNGEVMGIIDDFIGESIIIKHLIPDVEREFFTVYGHTIPADDIQIGKTFRAGEVIADVAGLSDSESGMSPHLHISIGFPISGEIEYNTIDWKTIDEKMTLIDPLQVIDRYCLI